MSNWRLLTTFVAGFVVAITLAVTLPRVSSVAHAQSNSLTALDYQEITQLINRYAYGIDTCANEGFDYANVFTEDGTFTDNNSDGGFAAGGRVLAQGRQARRLRGRLCQNRQRLAYRIAYSRA